MAPQLKPNQILVRGLQKTRKEVDARIKKLEEPPPPSADLAELKLALADLDRQIAELTTRTA